MKRADAGAGRERRVPGLRPAPGAVAAALYLALSALSPAVGEGGSATTVYLVRHAEKAAGGGDVALSEPQGVERAGDLATALGDAGVSAIIASDLRRTYDTVTPLAAEAGIAPGEILRITDPVAIAAEILDKHRGGAVVVSGHSNTVPLVIDRLGGRSLCPTYFEPSGAHGCMIPDDDYDHLFVLRLPGEGAPTLVRARYGEPSGREPRPCGTVEEEHR